MHRINDWNYETPIDEYPGFLGYELDGMVTMVDALQHLATTWVHFQVGYKATDQEPVEISVRSRNMSYAVTIDADNHWSFANILDQIPAFEVLIDDGPPDAGPAAGRTYVFVMGAGWSYADVKGIAEGLRIALNGVRFA
jgi:hypothetical protein